MVISKVVLSVVIFVTVFVNTGVASLKLTITPERAHVSKSENLTVTCNADVPLARCQFRHDARPVIDLSQGHLSNSTDDYKYFGNGLELGDCGVVLNTQHLINDTFHFVDCRVRTSQGGWMYELMEVFVTDLSPVNLVSMPPRVAVVLPGGNVTLLVKTADPLTKCRFRVAPLGWLDFTRDLSSNATSSYLYHGSGLQNGECGVTLRNVTEDLHGIGFVSIDTQFKNVEIFFIRFIVAQAPGNPFLEIKSNALNVSDLEATCTVSGGRPWGNISWYIGDELVRQDQENDAADDEWMPPRRRQTLTRKLRREDNGKDLRCVVTHIALNKSLEARTKISNITSVSTRHLTITPERAHITSKTNLTITCNADVPLAGCQFKHGSRPLIDLSQGHLTNSTDDYKYFGNGLEHGECGVVLNTQHLVNDTFHFVDCRVRTAQGGWLYELMEVFVTDLSPVNVLVMPPRQVVVLPGGSVSLLSTTVEPLTKCTFRLNPLQSLDFTLSQSSNDTTLYRYNGNGLQSGDCGVTLLNVTEEYNGLGFVSIDTKLHNFEIFFIRFIIARAPESPVMLGITSTTLKEGLDLQANCTVSGGRPWGNISWYIGDELVRQDQENDAADDEWMPPRRQQTLTRKLLKEDNGRDLRCVVTHVALSQELEARETIIFTGSVPTSATSTQPPPTSSTTRKTPSPDGQPTRKPTKDTSQLRLTITPERAHVGERDNLTVMCRANKPLAGCQFKHGSRPLIDLSQGHLTNSTDDYKYFGNGLELGDCGIVLNTQHLVNDTFHFVDCRVRTSQGSWMYEAMEVYVTDFNPINLLAMPPREVVVLPGSNVSLLVKTKAPLTKCRFVLTPVGWVDFTRSLASNATSLYQYYGKGLKRGECGLTLLNVTSSLNGVGFVSIRTKPFNQEILFIRFVVAKAPDPPVLVITSASIKEGSVLEATCTVSGGKPWGNISWYMGDELVRQDQENDATDNEWMPPRRRQTLTRKLRKEDAGRDLRCVVTHIALDQPLEARTRMRVTVPAPVTEMSAAPFAPTELTTYETSNSSVTEQAASKDTFRTNVARRVGPARNLGWIIGLVVAIAVSSAAALWIYAWYFSTFCYSRHPTAEGTGHGPIGMTKLLEQEEPWDSMTECSYSSLET